MRIDGPSTAAVHRPQHAQRPAETADATEVAAVDGDAPQKAKGGSDTPFTHALERGNGKKVGIHRRLEAQEIATLQQEAGVTDPTGATTPVEGAPTEAPVDEAPVDEAAAPAEEVVPVAAEETVPAEDAAASDVAPVVVDGSQLSPEPVVFETPLPVDDPIAELPVEPPVVQTDELIDELLDESTT